MKTYPVILCGGAGTRLWPLSNTNLPKQFIKLNQGETLFESTVKRIKDYEKPIIVSNEKWGPHIEYLLRDNQIIYDKLILEPEGKNTFPAICTAAHYVASKSEDANLIIMPADHFIADNNKFDKLIKDTLSNIKENSINVFGIKPLYPETCYGYLDVRSSQDTLKKIERFIEKPSREKAVKMLDDGNYLWNSGIFISKVKNILVQSKEHHPETYELCKKSIPQDYENSKIMHLNVDYWNNIKAESFDYAIMEKQREIYCMPFTVQWSDLGNYSTLKNLILSDESKSSHYGNVYSSNSNNNLIWNETLKQSIICSGISNCNIIANENGILVSEIGTDISKLLDNAKESGALSEQDDNCYRPWGFYETIKKTKNYHIKELFIYVGQRLSLQKHDKRDEFWIIIDGEAQITIDDDVKTHKKGSVVFIPKQSKHRIGNIGDKLLRIVEVQTGSYFGEDDIERFEDDYNRD